MRGIAVDDAEIDGIGQYSANQPQGPSRGAWSAPALARPRSFLIFMKALVFPAMIAHGFREDRTHSLQRTKASIIYKTTGNLRADQILLGHTKSENTVRYLGVDVEDALTLAEGIKSNDQIPIP